MSYERLRGKWRSINGRRVKRRGDRYLRRAVAVAEDRGPGKRIPAEGIAQMLREQHLIRSRDGEPHAELGAWIAAQDEPREPAPTSSDMSEDKPSVTPSRRSEREAEEYVRKLAYRADGSEFTALANSPHATPARDIARRYVAEEVEYGDLLTKQAEALREDAADKIRIGRLPADLRRHHMDRLAKIDERFERRLAEMADFAAKYDFSGLRKTVIGLNQVRLSLKTRIWRIQSGVLERRYRGKI